MQVRGFLQCHVLLVVSFQVWFYDGTVRCFADPGHGLLAVFALVLLMSMVGVFIILLVCLVKPKKVSVFWCIINIMSYFHPT